MSLDFTPWPSIPRLYRDVTVTEKIDGTNAAIQFGSADTALPFAAQSRSRIITPDEDNHGFARWVYANASTLHAILGEGLHFGEWWGSGVNRGYGLEKGEKRFSLFNTKRWAWLQHGSEDAPGLYSVPVLYQGSFEDWLYGEQGEVMNYLQTKGSLASPGYMNPEGVVVYHHAANHCFKYTLDGDGHKGAKKGWTPR